jgi:hypothetical protein
MTKQTVTTPAIISVDGNLTTYSNKIQVERDTKSNSALVVWEEYSAEYDLNDVDGINNEILFITQFLNADGSFNQSAFDAQFSKADN